MNIPAGVRHVLITGGLGFIGSSIAERLLAQGLRVTVVDDESSNVIEGSDLTSRFSAAVYVKEEIASFLGNAADFSCDLVVHAASYVGAAGVLPHAGTMAQHMINATGQVVSFCIARGAPLVYFSSSEVYGKSGTLSESTE